MNNRSPDVVPSWKEFFNELAGGATWKTTIILVLSPFLLTAWKYFASVSFVEKNLSPFLFGIADDAEGTARTASVMVAIHFGLSLIMLGLIPCCIVKFVFREKLRDYGVRLGDWKLGLATLACLAPLFAFMSYCAAGDSEILREYPLDKSLTLAPLPFASHAIGYLCFYLGWEFYFRGFMQVGLKPSFGPWNAILIQVLASCLLHIGKPTGEIFGSILGGILWGVIAYRTKSILAGLGMHATLGILLDFFIVSQR